jgi:hypothetical protein
MEEEAFSESFPKVVTVNNEIDQSMVMEIFGRLEIGRKFLL